MCGDFDIIYPTASFPATENVTTKPRGKQNLAFVYLIWRVELC